jgi:CSLREA domain-containing protein
MGQRGVRFIVGCGLLPLALGLEAIGAPPAHAAVTYTVTSATDTDDGSCDAENCTLREAINAANANAGSDTIEFGLGSGVPTIAVGSAGLGALPAITEPLILHGSNGGATRIELNGDLAGPAADGLAITGGGTLVISFVINGFSDDGVEFSGPGNNSIINSYVGTDVTGTIAHANRTGVRITSSAFNDVSGDVISGNSNGIVVVDETSAGNTIERNLIGTDPSGSTDVGNSSRGIVISGAVHTRVEDNTISGNDEGGIHLIDSGSAGHTADNRFFHNNIGTDRFGAVAIPNGRDGIRVEFAQRFAIIQNLISGNEGDGVSISSFTTPGFTGDGLVRGNVIGTDHAMTTALPNTNGIHLDRATNIQVEDNVAAGNHDSGILVDESFGEPPVPLGNVIEQNRIGINYFGTTAIPNRFGVHIDFQPGNTVGAGNVISGNSIGVLITGDETTSGNVVQGNLIGTDGAGTGDIGNTSRGVVISGAVGNRIEDNTISGNDEGGVHILDTGSSSLTADNVVHDNRIGTDAAGATALPNGRDGVLIDFAARTKVSSNVISGNEDDGVQVSSFTIPGFTGDGTIIDNQIGTDATGISAVPNGGHGVHLNRATKTEVHQNVISGNGHDGVHIDDTFGEPPVPLGNAVTLNRIGTNAAGTADLGNAVGVRIDNAAGNSVLEENLLSGNVLGVWITGPKATGNVVNGNFIGTDASHDGAIPNEADGVVIQSASGNTIGSPGAGNVIAHNGPGFIGGSGVVVSQGDGTAVANTIRGNSIYDNSRLGIDLGDDLVTANDAGDTDSGANTKQNFPVLTGASSAGTDTLITGTLNSTPSSTFDIDYYASDACDPSGNGEGQRYLWSLGVTTDASGNADVSAVAPGSLIGQYITATATNAQGDTSELSACRLVSAEPPGSLQFSASTYSVNEGAGTATITVTRTGGTGGTVSVQAATTGGSATPGSDYGLTVATLTFAPGQSTATFTVPIVDDNTYDPGETIGLTLSNPSGGATLGSPSTATVTIVENDPQPRVGTLLTAEPAIVRIGPGIQLNLYRLKARLTRVDNGAGIGGQTITMSLPRNGGGSVTVCTAVTAGNGWAECNGIASLLGITLNFGYTASYAGNATYVPATAKAGLIAIA